MDPHLAPYIDWDAQQLFQWDGDIWEHFVDEPCTANAFWNAQVSGWYSSVSPKLTSLMRTPQLLV